MNSLDLVTEMPKSILPDYTKTLLRQKLRLF